VRQEPSIDRSEAGYVDEPGRSGHMPKVLGSDESWWKVIIKAYGASDDIVELEIDGEEVDEFGCYEQGVTLVFADEKADRLRVKLQHSGWHGWQTLIRYPKGHNDGDPVPELLLLDSPTGYSMACSWELASGWSMRVVVGRKRAGVVNAGGWKPAKERV
jgi:hypothetical protein